MFKVRPFATLIYLEEGWERKGVREDVGCGRWGGGRRWWWVEERGGGIDRKFNVVRVKL